MRRAAVNIILIIVAVALFGACRRVSRVEWVEPLTDEHPDSAIAILRQLSEEKLSERDRAICNILLTRAIDKGSTTYQTDDSLARAALDYFSRHDDPHFEMLSNFYVGQIAFTNKNYGDAIFPLQKCVELAEDLGDHLNLALGYRTLADLYQKTYCGPDAVQASKLALAEFEKAGDKGEKYIKWAYNDLVNSYIACGELDTVVMMVERILAEFDLSDSPRLELALLCNKGIAFKDKYMADSAFLLVPRMMELFPPEQMDARDLYLLSYLYAVKGDAERSHYFADLVIQRGEEIYFEYINLYRAGKYKEAYLELMRVLRKFNFYFTGYEKSQISQSQKLYDRLKAERKAVEYQSRSARLKLWIVSAAFVAVVFIYFTVFFYRKYRRNEIEISLKADTIRELMESESQHRKEFAELQEHTDRIAAISDELREDSRRKDEYILTLQEEHNNIIKGVRRIIYDELKELEITLSDFRSGKSSAKADRRLIDNVNNIISRRKLKGASTKKIEAAINTNLNGLMKRFRDDFPNLSDIYYYVFMYSVAGFSTTWIALFLESEMKYISNIKWRLSKMIVEKNSEFSTEYLLFLK